MRTCYASSTIVRVPPVYEPPVMQALLRWAAKDDSIFKPTEGLPDLQSSPSKFRILRAENNHMKRQLTACGVPRISAVDGNFPPVDCNMAYWCCMLSDHMSCVAMIL